MKKLLLAVCLCSSFVSFSKNIHAGTGTFKDGQFNFCVSLRFQATPDEMSNVRNRFIRASQVIADATDGQHRFGTVTIVDNSQASEQAEFWIVRRASVGGVTSNAFGAEYGVQGAITMSYEDFFAPNAVPKDEESQVYAIAHEFAHSTYGLKDEYAGPNPNYVPGDLDFRRNPFYSHWV